MVHVSWSSIARDLRGLPSHDAESTPPGKCREAWRGGTATTNNAKSRQQAPRAQSTPPVKRPMTAQASANGSTGNCTGKDVAATVDNGHWELCRENKVSPAANSPRITMQDRYTKDFNYSRVNSKARRNQQIDDLDKRLREEKEVSRRLRSAVSILAGKLRVAEEGRHRSNELERTFFCHLAETEAVVIQTERLMDPGVKETRGECLEAARREAHKLVVIALHRELEGNGLWRTGEAASGSPHVVTPTIVHTTGDSTRGQEQPDASGVQHVTNRGAPESSLSPDTAKPVQNISTPLARKMPEHGERSPRVHEGRHQQGREHTPRDTKNGGTDGSNDTAAPAFAIGGRCWDSDAVLQAYRLVAARTVRRLSSALFGHRLLAVETAKTSAAQREKMLEGRAQALLESQVLLQMENDQLENFKAGLRAEVFHVNKGLEKANEQIRKQRNAVKDAVSLHSSLSWRILSMEVAQDDLSEAVGERLQVIQTAVRRRVGFIPRAVERAVHDLIGLCSAAAPSDGDDHYVHGIFSREKGLVFRPGIAISESRRTSRSSFGSSS